MIPPDPMGMPNDGREQGMLHAPDASPRRTPLRTEVAWFLGVVILGTAVALGGALWVLWCVFQAGAGC